MRTWNLVLLQMFSFFETQKNLMVLGGFFKVFFRIFWSQIDTKYKSEIAVWVAQFLAHLVVFYFCVIFKTVETTEFPTEPYFL